MIAYPLVPSAISANADKPSTASAAIITTDDGGVLLQHRDDKPGIWFPGYWGLFGGAIDDNESPLDALARELEEELSLDAGRINYFTQICFDLRRWGLGVRLRYFFEVPITRGQLDGLVLTEGQDAKVWSMAEALRLPFLTPYDRYALALYAAEADLRTMQPILGSTDDTAS